MLSVLAMTVFSDAPRFRETCQFEESHLDSSRGKVLALARVRFFLQPPLLSVFFLLALCPSLHDLR